MASYSRMMPSIRSVCNAFPNLVRAAVAILLDSLSLLGVTLTGFAAVGGISFTSIALIVFNATASADGAGVPAGLAGPLVAAEDVPDEADAPDEVDVPDEVDEPDETDGSAPGAADPAEDGVDVAVPAAGVPGGGAMRAGVPVPATGPGPGVVNRFLMNSSGTAAEKFAPLAVSCAFKTVHHSFSVPASVDGGDGATTIGVCAAVFCRRVCLVGVQSIAVRLGLSAMLQRLSACVLCSVQVTDRVCGCIIISVRIWKVLTDLAMNVAQVASTATRLMTIPLLEGRLTCPKQKQRILTPT